MIASCLSDLAPDSVLLLLLLLLLLFPSLVDSGELFILFLFLTMTSLGRDDQNHFSPHYIHYFSLSFLIQQLFN